MQTVCIFCGSNAGGSAAYAEATRRLVRAIAAQGLRIVFGGGNVGLMGVVAETAVRAGTHIIGVTPRRLLEREMVHTGLSELHVLDSMHERKVLMSRLADAFVVLPGGMGTLDELFEVATLNQLGVHEKACGILNVAGFFDHLRAYLDHAVDQRFINAAHRDMLLVDDEPERLLQRMKTWKMPQVSKWMDKKTGNNTGDNTGNNAPATP